jgi:hypothetical protein
MKSSSIKKVNEKVQAKNPKFADKSPKVTEQSDGNYLLIYTCRDALPAGKSINLTLRVIADDEGNIKKMTSSRG